MEYQFHRRNAPITRVSSDQTFGFCLSILGSSSMNQTVKTVREKLDKIQESGNQKRIIQPISQNLQIEPDSKKTRVDNNRRRI
ncbi:hypothetical protein BRARA_D01662 [Brassica rapa]|uniref:Uncharacterized protein n=1 Tax=Brassica campestris TaxID=3711 RepID=A0A397ZLK6_BRACM|nr:hypothetical protein BRARA_D01662 [Brassica rapa]